MEYNDDPYKILQDIQKLDKEISQSLNSLISLMKETGDFGDVDELIAQQIPDWKKQPFQPNEWVYWGFGHEYSGQVFGFCYYDLSGLLDLMARMVGPSSDDVFFCDLLDENPRWVYSVYHYESRTLYFIDRKYLTSATDVCITKNDMLIPNSLYEVGETIQWSVRSKPNAYPVWLGAGVILAKEYAYTSSQIISKARNNEQYFSLGIKTQLPCWVYLVRNVKLPWDRYDCTYYSDDREFWLPESFISNVDIGLFQDALDDKNCDHPLLCAIESNGENYENLEAFKREIGKVYTKMSMSRLNDPRKFNNGEKIYWNSQIPVAQVFDEEYNDLIEIFKGKGEVLDAVYVEGDLESLLYFDSVSQSDSDFYPCVLVDWEAFHLSSLYNRTNRIVGWVYLIHTDLETDDSGDIEIWLPEIYIKHCPFLDRPEERIEALQLSLLLDDKKDLGDLAIPPSLQQAMMIDPDLENAYEEGIMQAMKIKVLNKQDNCF